MIGYNHYYNKIYNKIGINFDLFFLFSDPKKNWIQKVTKYFEKVVKFFDNSFFFFFFYFLLQIFIQN